MLAALLHRVFSQLDAEGLKHAFFAMQLLLAVVVVGFVYLVSQKRAESGFRVREFEKAKKSLSKKGPDLASAKIQKNEPLRLSGIRLDGEPHEILGVSANASAEEIQKAYRELMKRYHPDAVGRPDSREWSDAQKIAEAINRARNQLLAAHSQSPKRSGR